MPATKKKPDNEILRVGDRLSVNHPVLCCRVTCDVVDVVDPRIGVRVKGCKEPVVAWATVDHSRRPSGRRRSSWRVDDRIPVLAGRWRRIRCVAAPMERQIRAAMKPEPPVPSTHIDFAPIRPHHLGIPNDLVSKIVREDTGDGKSAYAPLLVMSGRIATIGAARGDSDGSVEREIVVDFVRHLFRASDGGLDTLFESVFETMSVLTRYVNPAEGVKKVLGLLGERLSNFHTPEWERAATWIGRFLPGAWAKIVVCRFWLTCNDRQRRDAIAQYRGQAEALKMVPIPTPPESERE